MMKGVPRYMRAANEEHIQRFRERTASGLYDLSSSEIWWRDRIEILHDHGYQLRTRLRPGWTPSWSNNDMNPRYCEDSHDSFYFKVIDAVRESDKKDVVIMQLKRTSDECKIFEHVVNAQQASGKNQHIVPLLDRFHDDREPDLRFLVMPMLRECYLDPYYCVPEVVHFVQQTLEGLAFMHSVGVAHRDCAAGNIFMDAPSIFRNGFHPVNPARDRKGVNGIMRKPRYKAKKPIEYYFNDFGISRIFDPEETHIALGDDGADRDVPEMSAVEFYDPFPADVFILGNTVKKEFLSKYDNLTFLSPWANAMTARDPKDRPTAEEALKEFNSIIASQSFFTLRRKLVKKDKKKKLALAVFEDVGILLSVALTPVNFVISIPPRTIRAVGKLVTSKIPKKKKGKTA